MSENVPYTSYLSQKEHSFIKKIAQRFEAFEKNFFVCKCKGLKMAPPQKKKILARTLCSQTEAFKFPSTADVHKIIKIQIQMDRQSLTFGT
jgi:hypothetical protein